MADDPRPTESKYTSERLIPGAFEGETVTRRRFMTGTVQVAGGVATAAFLLPALGFAIGPVFEKHHPTWQAVGSPREFPEDTYIPKVITIVQGIGQAGKTTTYVRKRNPRVDTDTPDQYNRYIAISTRCMHLGCPVRYVSAAQRFICPCHGGVYDFEGLVAGGPPAGPLLHAHPQRPARDRPALLGQQPVAALLPARSRPAAGRDRPVPLPVASDRSQVARY